MDCSGEYLVVRLPVVLALEPIAYIVSIRRQYNVVVDNVHISAATIMNDILEVV